MLPPGANYIKLLIAANLGSPFKGRLLASPTNIRVVWKGLPGTNTLAYYENPLVKAVKV